MTSANDTIIAYRGTLELMHNPGDDQNPETFTVLEPETGYCASLEVARECNELAHRSGHTKRPTGSQAVTIRDWHEAYL